MMVGRVGALIKSFADHARQMFLPARIYCVSGYTDTRLDWAPCGALQAARTTRGTRGSHIFDTLGFVGPGGVAQRRP